MSGRSHRCWPGAALLALAAGCLRPRGRPPHAFARPATRSAEAAAAVLRRAAGLPEGGARPPESGVLQAILDAQQQKTKLNTQSPFYGKLTGHGREGGKKWRLVYLANRNAVVAARKGIDPPSLFDRGWYVDGLVTAVQRFEDSPGKVNQNGIFEFLGVGGFFFGYFARFKWPSPATRTTMAFQPVTTNFHAFGQDWSWPFAGSAPGAEGRGTFDGARLQDLNIFNFLYIDDKVAVAQGASGGVALWAAADKAWADEHLVDASRGAPDL
uniref:Uncharacterized protein n=1 Tax=Alexandrium monilatum TaxID=311494 RepID=A0A7S4SL20_9DINO